MNVASIEAEDYSPMGPPTPLLWTLAAEGGQYLNVALDLHPPSTSPTMPPLAARLSLQTGALAIVYSHSLVTRLATLFSLRSGGPEGAMASLYREGLRDASLEAQHRLKQALAQRLAFDVSLDIKVRAGVSLVHETRIALPN